MNSLQPKLKSLEWFDLYTKIIRRELRKTGGRKVTLPEAVQIFILVLKEIEKFNSPAKTQSSSNKKA